MTYDDSNYDPTTKEFYIPTELKNMKVCKFKPGMMEAKQMIITTAYRYFRTKERGFLHLGNCRRWYGCSKMEFGLHKSSLLFLDKSTVAPPIEKQFIAQQSIFSAFFREARTM